MSKEKFIEFMGQVEKSLPNAEFRVKLENGHVILAKTSGRMLHNHIKILVGDSVTVEFSAYDFSKGRIIHRHK